MESVCVFGSAARDSVDQYSDRDVLIVASDWQCREDLVRHWREDGWSVATYTPNRLKKMIGAGSLFVQHLRLEGRIVTDKSGWLKDTLWRAVPKESYFKDAAASVALAQPIERFCPHAKISEQLISADMAYVALRNFGICYLADRNQLSFDYAHIVSRLSEDFGLRLVERELLASLRGAKALYRKGVGCADIEGNIKDLSKVLSKFFVGQPLTPVSPSCPVRRLAGGYSTIRDFEASIVAKHGRTPTESEIHSVGLDDVWRWVKRPRDYTWGVRNCSVGQLNRLLANRDPIGLESLRDRC